MMTVDEQKRELRQRVEQERTALVERQPLYTELSEAICSKIIRHPDWSKAEQERATFFAYVPFRSEVDLKPLLSRLWEQGLPLLLPRVEAAGKRMTLHYTTSWHDLEVGRWGLMEPRQELPVWHTETAIDWMIVPGLAFDRGGGRLGYGGGYYDRWYAGLAPTATEKGWTLPRRIAPAFSLQVVDKVPIDSHDMTITDLITESGWIHCGS